MSSVRNKTDRLSLVKQLIAGTNKHFPNASQSLVFAGATHTPPAVAQLLQSYVDLRTSVLDAQAAVKSKTAAERSEGPPLLAFIDDYVAFVRATFGKAPDALADFGLAPPKARAPLTAEKKAAAVAKRDATRQARHTMGKNQKKSVKGDVVGITVTPVTGAAKPVVQSPALIAPSPGAPSPGAPSQGTGGAGTPHAS